MNNVFLMYCDVNKKNRTLTKGCFVETCREFNRNISQDKFSPSILCFKQDKAFFNEWLEERDYTNLNPIIAINKFIKIFPEYCEKPYDVKDNSYQTNNNKVASFLVALVCYLKELPRVNNSQRIFVKTCPDMIKDLQHTLEYLQLSSDKDLFDKYSNLPDKFKEKFSYFGKRSNRSDRFNIMKNLFMNISVTSKDKFIDIK